VHRIACARSGHGSQIWNAKDEERGCLVFQAETYEHCAELVFAHVADGDRRADLDGDDEVQATVNDLLVSTDRFDCFGNRQISDRWQRAKLGDQLCERRSLALGHRASNDGKIGGGKHAQGDRFTMSEPPVLCNSFERVAYCVSEIENSSKSALALVLGYHIGLDAAGIDDGRNERGRILCEDGFGVRVQAIEQIAIRNHAVLHDFIETRTEFTARQRLEQRRIDDDESGLVKRTDQVLAERVIDADLSADRAVDLCKECRRHVNEGNPAQERRRRKSRRVADDPASDCDDRASSIGVGPNERLVDLRDRLQVLVALTVGKKDRVPVSEGRTQPVAMKAPHDGTRHDKASWSNAVAIKE